MKNFRNRTIKSLGFLFLLFFAGSAKAASGDHSVGLMVGQVWPAGEIAKDVEGAVAPGIFYEYSASEVFSLYAQGVRAYHNEGSLKTTSTNLGMKAHLVYYDKLVPYVMVGAGLYFVKKELSAPREAAEKTVFGLHLGLGAELDLSNLFFIGLQFDVHSLFAGTAITPSSRKQEISGRWTGFFLKGGVRF